MRRAVTAIASAVSLLGASAPLHAQNGDGNTAELANGIRVVLIPVEGATQIGVETFFEAGFIHEPRAQLAHFIEHLICYCPTASHGPGEAMKLLESFGMANAETMPTLTHFDATASIEQLDQVLAIEAERLTSVRLDPAIMAREAPRCAAELTNIESSPMAPVTKFAFMGAAEAWRTGADQVRVKGGIEDITVEEIEDFRRAMYGPDRMLLVLCGGFDRQTAMRSIARHFGPLDLAKSTGVTPIDYANLPAWNEVTWDSTARALIVGFVPPADPAERMALSLWSTMVGQQMNSDAEIQRVSSFTLTSSFAWPVGELPLFISASLLPDVDPHEASAILATKLRESAQGSTSGAMLGMMTRQLMSSTSLTPEILEQQTKQLVQLRHYEQDQAEQFVVLNTALQAGVRTIVFGDDPDVITRAIEILESDELADLLARSLTDERLFVTLLRP